MSYSLRIEDDGETEVFSLATTQGLADMARWAESLPAKGFDKVKAFFADGSLTGTDALASQLGDALDLHEPDDSDTFHTAKNLLETLGVGDSEETAAIE